MSPFFIKQFKVKNPCRQCPDSAPATAAPGKQFCPGHLAKARMRWRIWGHERRKLGKCISCDRAGVLNRATKIRNCRCTSHREENRIKCENWMREHPGTIQKSYQKSLALINSGICRCSLKATLKPGARRCDTCRAYSRAKDKGDQKTIVKILKLRHNARTQLAKRRATEAKRTLASRPKV